MEILRFILFSLPESIFLSLVIVYVLNIKCSRVQRILAILYTSMISYICYCYVDSFGINVITSSLVLSMIYKGWYDYDIPIIKYWITTIGTLLIMFSMEVFISVPMIFLCGLDVLKIQDNISMLFFISIPLRVIQFTILYLLYRRYNYD